MSEGGERENVCELARACVLSIGAMVGHKKHCVCDRACLCMYKNGKLNFSSFFFKATQSDNVHTQIKNNCFGDCRHSTVGHTNSSQLLNRTRNLDR